MPNRLPTIDDKTLLGEYLSESQELLEALITDLDSMVARPGSEPDVNLVNRIFRTVHSLKGLSGMMGLDEVQSLAHEFEDVLDDLRLGRLVLDRETRAGFQEAGAGFAALFGGAARGSATEEDCDRFRGLLTAIAARSQAQSKQEVEILQSLGLAQSEQDMLTELETHRLVENLKAGRAIFALSVELATGALDSGYRALVSKVNELGELISTLPATSSTPTLVGLRLLIATQNKESEIKRTLKAYGGRLDRLGASSWQRAGAALKGVGRRQSKPDKAAAPTAAPLSSLLPPSFAQESLQPLSPSVRVELFQIDELSGLAHQLAIETENLATMADRRLAERECGARDRFDLKFSARRIERGFLDLEERLVGLRMVSLAQTFTRAARLAGRLARELGKSVAVEVTGRETQLDKVIVDRISDAIYHILRNAIDHGIELPEARRLAGKPARGKIKIAARLEGTRAIISISDDGRGIDRAEVRRRAIEIGAIGAEEELTGEETLRLIFRPSFSTAGHVSPISGRGVGLDAVERAVADLGGFIRVFSERGEGTRFDVSLPTTLVMVSAFIIRSGGWPYAIDVGQIIELIYVGSDSVLGRDGRRSVEWRGEPVPLVELAYLLGLGGARLLSKPDRNSNGDGGVAHSRSRVPAFITRAADRTVAIAVDQFDGQREIIVKSLGALGGRFKGVSGAVDLEGGEVALVVDLPNLLLHRSMRL